MPTNYLRNALAAVESERLRQYRLKQEGRFRYTPSEVTAIRALAMLMEEVGEASRAALAVSGYVQESLTVDDYRTELVQIAAITVAMIERVDAAKAGTIPGDML